MKRSNELKAEGVLRGSLRVGAAYFVAVTIAHWVGWKVPGLFIYYNIPSYAYQDRCIGVLCFGWAIFLFAAARHAVLVPALLVAGAAALLGYSMINLSPELAALAPPQGLAGCWLIVLSLAGYLTWVAAWFWLAQKGKRYAP